MAVKIAAGTIIFATVVDPAGRNPKVRPLVVVKEFADGDVDLLCVAVSSQVPTPLHAGSIPLRWHGDKRQSSTGLTAPSVAVAHWQVTVAESSVVGRGKQVSARELAQILAALPVVDGDEEE